MNTKILALLIAVFMVLTPLAMADAPSTSPRTFTVNFEVTAQFTTDFSVQTNTAQLNFTNKTGAGLIDPVGGNPWGNITNDGGQNLNFTVAANNPPSGIDLRIGSTAGDVISVTTIPGSPAGWIGVPNATSRNIVTKANYGPAPVGPQTENMTIASST